MTFTDSIAEVLAITKRPDKRTEIAGALNRAMAFFTLKADFTRDMVEVSVPIDTASYGQSIDLTASGLALTRFRKIKVLRPRNARRYMTEADPGSILVPNGTVQPNRFYVIGNNLSFTLSALDSHLELAYLQYAPIITEAPGNNTHWMLDLMPWAIQERAASQIFKNIGDETSAAHYQSTSMEFFLAARRDFETQIAAAAS